MLKKLKTFIHKIIFIIKEIYKTGPKMVFSAIICMIIAGVSPVLTSYMTSELLHLFEINLHNAKFNLNIKILIVAIVFTITINLFVNGIKFTFSEIVGCRLSHNIENLIANKFQDIPQSKLDSPIFLDLYKNASTRASYAPVNLLHNLFGVLSTGIGLFGYLIILLQLDKWCLVGIIIFIALNFYFKQKFQIKEYYFLKNNTNRFRQIEYFFSLISEKQYAKEIRIFNIFEFLKNKRNFIFKSLMKERKRFANINIKYMLIISVYSLVGMIILELWLTCNLIENVIPLSKFVLYNTTVISFLLEISYFVEEIISSNRNMRFLNYLFDFLDYECQKSIAKCTLKADKNFIINFKNVSFKYPGAKKFSLKNINLELCVGKKFCIVGENGSGKTTLIKMLLGLYQPTEGHILLNGKDIKDYDVKEYQNLFGVTFQDFIHYFIDVKSNIAFGDVNKIEDIDYIEEVSTKSNLKKVIENYPKSYDTKLSKEFFSDAIEPSIGQWQKFAIARTIFKDSPILLLDEPTASLDPKSEEEIFRTINGYSKDKMIIFISHRLCNSKIADNIILLESGEIVESGTHAELIAKKGKYSELYYLQAQKYE